MAAPNEAVEELILQDIETALAGIDGNPNYFYTFPSGHVKRANMGGLEVVSFPFVFFNPEIIEADEEPREVRVLQKVTKRMHVSIQAFLERRTEAVKEVQRLIRDIEFALSVDRTRGGNAIDSKLITAEPWYPASVDEPICGADIAFGVQYRHVYTDPSTA